MSRSGGPGFFAGTLFGGAIGAGLALLLAPKAGQELRRELAARGAARSEPTASGDAGLTDLALGVLGTARERVERALDEARRAAETTRLELTAEWEARKAGRR